MNFQQFAKKVKEKFDQMQKDSIVLFESSVTGNELWELYISSFLPKDNPVFRDPNSTTHNCNLDKNFIRRYGNVVSINSDYEIETIWDVELAKNDPYYLSAQALTKKLKSSSVGNIFIETYDELNSLPYEKTNKSQAVYRLGIEENHKIYTQKEVDKFGVVTKGQVYKFYHFYADLDKKFVDFTDKSKASILGKHKSNKDVFFRGMSEIPVDTLLLVKDLINQGSLLDGQTHLYKIEVILPLKREFDNLSNKQIDNWSWIKSHKLDFAKFRNELIGNLCIELAEGKELNEACQTWNKRVDPSNYMKAKAPITKRQIEEAEKFVQEQGYEESFDRRFATIDDINVDEILHSNVGKGEIKTASVFNKVKATSTSTRHKRSEFDKVEEVSIEKFMKDILPGCTSIEAYFENRMEGNLVALTTANVKESKPMFKWSNNFSWTYKGNLAGKSMIKEAVKSRGGKVEAPVRISIHFPDTTSDYDLHCIEPNKNEIYFGNKRRTHSSSGMLDLDAQGMDGYFPPEKRVENITYSDISKMPNGEYRLFVYNYSGNRIQTAFNAEIEIEGELTTLLVKASAKRTVEIGKLKSLNGEITFIPDTNDCNIGESKSVSKNVWNLDSNEFHKVNLVCLTPNHWGENNIGNKHYLFMLDNCKSDLALRSFHTENLNADLLQHRKVMEVLGTTTMLEPTNTQLCGLGFNASVKDEIILKLQGTHKRMIKVKFDGVSLAKESKKELQEMAY